MSPPKEHVPKAFSRRVLPYLSDALLVGMFLIGLGVLGAKRAIMSTEDFLGGGALLLTVLLIVLSMACKGHRVRFDDDGVQQTGILVSRRFSWKRVDSCRADQNYLVLRSGKRTMSIELAHFREPDVVVGYVIEQLRRSDARGPAREA